MSNQEIYISHKKVTRIPMTRQQYNDYRGWDLPANEDGNDEGYLVEYLDGGKSNHPDHEGYISWSPKEQFDAGYKLIEEASPKSLGNTDVNGAKKNVSDLVVFGNGDTFKLLSKASSKREGWMKSTKVMEIQDAGCVVQVTTQQGDHVAEALTFVPGVRLLPANQHGPGGITDYPRLVSFL